MAVTRKTVEDETVVPIVHMKTFLNYFFHDLVRDQLARRREPADTRAQLGMTLNVPTENVSDADMHEIEVLSEHFCLGSFATPLHSHDDVLMHGKLRRSIVRICLTDTCRCLARRSQLQGTQSG